MAAATAESPVPDPVALTFDVWDTLIVDDSDEPARAAAGLPPKAQARRAAFAAMVARVRPDLDPAAVDAAFTFAEETFRRWWKVEHHTPRVAARLDVALGQLGISARPADFDAVVASMEGLEVALPPRACDGVHAALAALAARHPLGIISDAIVTPGVGIRQILAHHDLLRHFTFCVFSDEVGASKPAPAVFAAAAAGLGVAPHQLIHVGDREANDIAGPLAVGARALLYTGAIDRRGDTPTAATAHFSHYDQLPALIAALVGDRHDA